MRGLGGLRARVRGREREGGKEGGIMRGRG